MAGAAYYPHVALRVAPKFSVLGDMAGASYPYGAAGSFVATVACPR